MELYNELRENWERLYWDEGYSKKLAQDHANYESAEDDDGDFSPYRFSFIFFFPFLLRLVAFVLKKCYYLILHSSAWVWWLKWLSYWRIIQTNIFWRFCLSLFFVSYILLWCWIFCSKNLCCLLFVSWVTNHLYIETSI